MGPAHRNSRVTSGPRMHWYHLLLVGNAQHLVCLLLMPRVTRLAPSLVFAQLQNHTRNDADVVQGYGLAAVCCGVWIYQGILVSAHLYYSVVAQFPLPLARTLDCHALQQGQQQTQRNEHCSRCCNSCSCKQMLCAGAADEAWSGGICWQRSVASNCL